MRSPRWPGRSHAKVAAAVGLALSIAFGLCLWVLLWGLGVKSIDAIMITGAIALTAAALRILAPYLPGNRADPDDPESGGRWISR